MASTRQLAAIMFTDIVGYTAMMQKDEKQAVALSMRYISVLKQSVSLHSGEVLNDYGDGSLCIFHSATEAVHCALEIQTQLQSEPVVPLRIGLHIGEIFFEDGKIFGDGVNIASRTQSLGQANTVLFTREIFDKIRNQPEYKSVSLGFFEFKNIDVPMEVFALTNEGLFMPQRKKMEGKVKNKKFRKRNVIAALSVILFSIAVFLINKNFFAKKDKTPVTEKSIAVLPFKVIGNDSEVKYFADGVAEALKNNLLGIKNLRVRTGLSVERATRLNKSIPEINKDLKVDYIIDGSVQKIKEDLLIYINLNDLEKDQILWENKYNKKHEDIFKVYGEIALDIVSSMNLTLMGEPTKSKEAWDLYQKGMSYLRNFGKYREKNDAIFAFDFFTRAIKIDTTFALAYTWLGEALWYKGNLNTETKDSILMLWEKSMRLDPGLSENYNRLGLFYSQELNDFDKAIQYYKKGISIDPDNADLFSGMAITLFFQNKYLDALAYGYRSIRNEPGQFYTWSLRDIGISYLSVGEFDWAEVFLKKALELEPDNFVFLGEMSHFRMLQGNYEEVLKLANKSLSIEKNNMGLKDLGKAYLLMGEYAKAENAYSQFSEQPRQKTYYAQVLRKLGKEKEALKQINEAKEWIERNMFDPTLDPNYDLATIYSFLGEKKKALEYLNKWKVKKGKHVWVEKDPLFENIKNEPEFKQLVQRFKSEVEVLRKEARVKIASGEFPTPEMIRQ